MRKAIFLSVFILISVFVSILVLEKPISLFGDTGKIASMEQLFDIQIDVLRARGFSDDLLAELNILRGEVVVRATFMDVPKSNIPFLPVVPMKYVQEGKCGKVDIGWQGGAWENYRPDSGLGKGVRFYVSRSDIYSIKDVYELPKKPYYIFNVSYNRVSEQNPIEARKRLEESGFRVLSIMEGASLYLLSSALSECNFWLSGTESKIGNHPRIPNIYLIKDENGEDVPVLEFQNIDRGEKADFTIPYYETR